MANAAKESRAWLFIVVAVVSVLAGAVLGAVALPLFIDERFRRDFFTSPGFGGLAAVAAAGIAYAAARYSARSARAQGEADRALTERRDRKEQWWARAEWALTQVATGDDNAAIIGLGVLEALGKSEWADEHEADIIAAATDFALETEEVEIEIHGFHDDAALPDSGPRPDEDSGAECDEGGEHG